MYFKQYNANALFGTSLIFKNFMGCFCKTGNFTCLPVYMGNTNKNTQLEQNTKSETSSVSWNIFVNDAC